MYEQIKVVQTAWKQTLDFAKLQEEGGWQFQEEVFHQKDSPGEMLTILLQQLLQKQ